MRQLFDVDGTAISVPEVGGPAPVVKGEPFNRNNPMSEADKLAVYHSLRAGGLSDYESRGTVWGNEWDTPEESKRVSDELERAWHGDS